MNKYVEHLKSKGYRVTGNIAVLRNERLKICNGKINTAMGIQKSYWLELIG